MSRAAKTPAAAYIRMSGREQEKSPKEQRDEIATLATREGCRIAQEHWFADEAITGDSTTDERPGLAALLAAAKAGKFKVLLAWHTNRVSREDPMDAIVFYNQLRKAGVTLHTCCEGPIDLEDFPKQLLLFVNQKASNDYLTELAAKSLRGKIACAKAGDWAAGGAAYGMDRAEFDAKGSLVRRLARGDRRNKRNRLRLVPSNDPVKLDAIRYAFQRADAVHLSFGQLARELQTKGYPAPRGQRWTRSHVARLLTTCAYAGISRFGRTASGKYYEACREQVIRCDKAKARAGQRRKPDKDTITVLGAYEPIISIDLFHRVYEKVKPALPKARRTANDRYPLSGLLYCGHCGRRMVARGARFTNRKGVVYKYQKYICSTAAYFGRNDCPGQTCGCHTIHADRALEWLLYTLKEIYLLGPGHESLIEKIREKLNTRAKPSTGETARLRKQLAELDRQVNRLVAAIRTTDAPELAAELKGIKAERDSLRTTLLNARKPATPKAPATEAERIADQLRRVRQHLANMDAACLREVLRRFVVKIECEWATKPGKHNTYRLRAARVELRNACPVVKYSLRGHDAPADIAAGIVSLRAGSRGNASDCAAALADLLISICDRHSSTKRNTKRKASTDARPRAGQGRGPKRRTEYFSRGA